MPPANYLCKPRQKPYNTSRMDAGHLEDKYAHLTVEQYLSMKNQEEVDRLRGTLQEDIESFKVRAGEVRDKIVTECEDTEGHL